MSVLNYRNCLFFLLALKYVVGFLTRVRTRIAGEFSHKTNNIEQRSISVRSNWCSPSRLQSSYALYFENTSFEEGKVAVTRTEKNSVGENQKRQLSISYTLVQPTEFPKNDTNSDSPMTPLVVLHGGPSLPSEYCFPLAHYLPDRPILFYDQLGCGRSDEPDNPDFYSIGQALDDLDTILSHLSIRKFHLYGHSFGGILAYEYLVRCSKRMAETNGPNISKRLPCCLSLILSSAPTDIQQMEENWNTLTASLASPDLFRETHLCRTPTIPLPLQNAYSHAGTIWSGTSAIADYKAINSDSSLPIVKDALILRGEYDIVTEENSKKWKDELLFQSKTKVCTLEGCSHHGLLENGPMYGNAIESFLAEQSNTS